MSTISWVILIILAAIVFWFVGGYNHFIRLITRAKEAWADIDVQLKRRYDLIPNLINTVKGYVSHEAGTLQKITEARNMAMKAGEAGSPKATGQAENMLTGALKSIFALSENYPDLKANQNFLELQRELSDTANKIQASRRFYNVNVRDLNIGIDSFPNNIIANIFKFKKMEFFDLPDAGPESKPVEVKF